MAPQKVRLKNSDETIVSFDMFMEADDKKPSQKPRKHLFERFAPGICLKPNSDEDNEPYMPDLSKSDGKLMETKRTDRYFLGKKCKPGGCLDPPFDEDTHAYEPVVVPLGHSAGKAYIIDQQEDESVNSKQGLEILNKKRQQNTPICIKPIEEEGKITDSISNEANMKPIRQSIITYKPEHINQDTVPYDHEIMSKTEKREDEYYKSKNKTKDTEPLKVIPAAEIHRLHDQKTKDIVYKQDEPTKDKKETNDYNKPFEISALQKKSQEDYEDKYPYPDVKSTPLIDQTISEDVADYPSGFRSDHDYPSYLRSDQNDKNIPLELRSGQDTEDYPPGLRLGQDIKDYPSYLRSNQDTKDHPSGLRLGPDTEDHPSYLRSGQATEDHPSYPRTGQYTKEHPSDLRSGQEDHPSDLRSGQDTKDRLSGLRSGPENEDYSSDPRSGQHPKDHPSYLRTGQAPEEHPSYPRTGQYTKEHPSYLKPGQNTEDHPSDLRSGQDTKDRLSGPRSDQATKDHMSGPRSGQDTKDFSSYLRPGQDIEDHPSGFRLAQDTKNNPLYLKSGQDPKDRSLHLRPGQDTEDLLLYLGPGQDTEDHPSGLRLGPDAKDNPSSLKSGQHPIDHPSYLRLGQATEDHPSYPKTGEHTKDYPSYLRSGQDTADLDFIKVKEVYRDTKDAIGSDSKKAEPVTSITKNASYKNYHDKHLFYPGVQTPLLRTQDTLEIVNNLEDPNQNKMEPENSGPSFKNNKTRKTPQTSNEDNYKSEPVLKSSIIYDSDTKTNVTDYHKEKRKSSKLDEKMFNYNSRKSKESSFSIKSVLQNIGPIRKSITHSTEKDNKERKTGVVSQENLEQVVNEPINAFFIPPKGIKRDSKSRAQADSSKRQSGNHKPIDDKPVELLPRPLTYIPVTINDSHSFVPLKQEIALEETGKDKFKDDVYTKQQIKSEESPMDNETKQNRPGDDNKNQLNKEFLNDDIDNNKITKINSFSDKKNTSITVVSDKIKYSNLDNEVTSDYINDQISPIPHAIVQTESETYPEKNSDDRTQNLISDFRNDVNIIEKELLKTFDKSERFTEQSSDRIKIVLTDNKLDTLLSDKHKEVESVIDTESIKTEKQIQKLIRVNDILDTHINENLESKAKTTSNEEIIEILSISDQRSKLERNFSETFEEMDNVNLKTEDNEVAEPLGPEKKEYQQPKYGTFSDVGSYNITEQQSKERIMEEHNANKEIMSTKVENFLEYQGVASSESLDQKSDGRSKENYKSGKEITSPVTKDFYKLADITYPNDLTNETAEKQYQVKMEEERLTIDLQDHEIIKELSYIEKLYPQDTSPKDNRATDSMFDATAKRIEDEDKSLTTAPTANFIDLKPQIDSTIHGNSKEEGEIPLPPSSSKIPTNIETISLNLAFHSYVNNKNEKIFETILNEHDVPRYPNDSITVIASQIRISSTENLPELNIPMDSKFDLIIKIKGTDQGQKKKYETEKFSKTSKSQAMPSIPPSGASSIKTAPARESVKPRTKTQQDPSDKMLHRTLTYIYEQELVPLQNMIRDLKTEIDFLSEQRILLSKRVICSKKSAQRKKISQKFSFS